MHRNVMSRNIARRFGAYANNARIYQHARLFSSYAARQHTASALYEHNHEHRNNLAVLQEEDRWRLIRVKAHLDKYTQLLENAQKTVDDMPIMPLQDDEHPRASHELRVSKILATMETLRDRLESLRMHLEDLETEPYPAVGVTDEDIDWETSVRNMSPEVRQQNLAELELEIGADKRRAVDNLRVIREAQSASDARIPGQSPIIGERKGNPFPSAGAKSLAASYGSVRKKGNDRLKYGLGRGEQAESVASAVEGRSSHAAKAKRAVDKTKEKPEEKEQSTYSVTRYFSKSKIGQAVPATESKGDNKPKEEEQANQILSQDFQNDRNWQAVPAVEIKAENQPKEEAQENHVSSQGSQNDRNWQAVPPVESKIEPKPKERKFGSSLLGLQAKLEEALKKSR